MALVELSATVVSTNRYAPSGANEVRLFNYNGAENLTLAQLVAAVCVRRSAQIEDQAVGAMNLMTNTIEQQEKLSDEVNAMAALPIPGADADWANRRKRLIALGCSESALPSDITSYKNRMQAYEAVEKRLQALNTVSDRAGIELQTATSRRDMIFTVASTTTVHLGASMAQSANALKR